MISNGGLNISASALVFDDEPDPPIASLEDLDGEGSALPLVSFHMEPAAV